MNEKQNYRVYSIQSEEVLTLNNKYVYYWQQISKK